VPDLDILERSVQPHWFGPAKLLDGGEVPPEQLVRSILRSLCTSLRKGGGLPGLQAYVQVVAQVASGLRSVAQGLAQLDSLVREAHGDRHSRIAAKAVARLVVDLGEGAPTPLDPTTTVAASFCGELIEHHLFGRLRPERLDWHFGDRDGGASWLEQSRQALNSKVLKIAHQLTRDPTAAKLVSPTFGRRERRPTRDQLEDVVS